MQQASPTEARAGIEVSREVALTGRLMLQRLTEAARRPGNRNARVNRLSYEAREALFRQEPWLWRGTLKQTGDLVKHGFSLIVPDSDDTHPDDPLFQAWLRKTRAFARCRDALMSAHLHGDGLVEIEWDDGGRGDEPLLNANAFPVALHLIDPVTCDLEEDPREPGVLYLVQQGFGRRVVLHPDRYHHFFFYRLTGYDRAIATVEVAFHAGMAKVKGDQGSGEVVYNAGQPKVHAMVKDPGNGELEEKTEMVNDPDFVRGWVTDDRTTFTQLNPVALDLTPFAAYWKSSEAAAIGLPVMLLEGAQAGSLTGSETNLADYESDQLQVKTNTLQEFFVRMASAVIMADETGFDIRWAKAPVLPSAQATLSRDRGTALTLFLAAGLTREAAAREAGLELGDDDWLAEDPRLLAPVTDAAGQLPSGTVPRPLPPNVGPGPGTQPLEPQTTRPQAAGPG